MKDRIPYGATPQECAGWWLDLNGWGWPEELGEEEPPEAFDKLVAEKGILGDWQSKRQMLMVELARRCTDQHINEEADKRVPSRKRHHIGGPKPAGWHTIRAHR